MLPLYVSRYCNPFGTGRRKRTRLRAVQLGVAVGRTRRSLRSFSRPLLNASIVGQTGEGALSSDDYDDPALEARWLAQQRGNVQRYLETQGVRHLGVNFDCAWFVAPYVSVWTVRSLATPGSVGWWAISGDLPTDYLSGGDATDARSALVAFARRWQEVAERMRRGEDHPDMSVGAPENRTELGDLLSRRAEVIQDWVRDDSLW